MVAKGVANGVPMQKFQTSLKSEISRYYGLTRKERAQIYNYAYDLTRKMKAYKKMGCWEQMFSRREVFDGFNRITRRIEADIDLRWRRFQTRVALDSGIFFMCSVHQNCAEDHQDLQGKIYVNRYWRQLVNSTDYAAVAGFIKNNNIKTVQEMMRAPYWLTTRRYCRHWFIEIPTEKVLNSSIGKVRKSIGYVKFIPYTQDNYYADRCEVYRLVNSIQPCQNFARMCR